jgi:hypothetical protein
LAKFRHLPKAFKADTLAKVAAKLAAMNKPRLIDYRRVFCLDDIDIAQVPVISNQDNVITGDYAI